MNTPRTKPPVRYSPKLGDAPEGMYSAGIANMGLATAVGCIITYWPHTEEHMVTLFGELVGIEDDASARLVFRSIINQNTRLAIMRAMLEKSPQHKTQPLDLDELISEFASLNGTRNAYAHGLWYTHEDGKRIFIEEETAAYDKFLDKREVTSKELENVLSRMVELVGKLIERHKRVMLARELASPQTPPQPPSGNSPESPNPETT